MKFPELKASQYHVEFFTERYIFGGTLEPFGLLMVFLNDPDRKTLRLKDVIATRLDANSTIGSFRTEEVFVRRDEIVAIRLFVRPSTHTVPLMPYSDKLRLFLPRFAVQAVFHRGPETRLNDIFDTSGYWAPATEALIHPITPTKHPVAPEAPMLLINKKHIHFYQAVHESPPTEAPQPDTGPVGAQSNLAVSDAK
jgi:hypothetical protein